MDANAVAEQVQAGHIPEHQTPKTKRIFTKGVPTELEESLLPVQGTWA